MDARDAANRDLLIGLLALQNGLVEQDALVAAFRAWTRDKARPIADILAERGAVDAAERALLEGLAETHLRRHGGNVEKSLAAVNAGRSTRESLAAVGDPDIEATLAQVGSGSADPVAERTGTYHVGGATSDGARFRVLRPHARGGLGEVFVALDEELHREVALKQILGHHADDPTSRTRFVLEAEITGGLEHPGIVPVYGLGSYGDGRPYYAMRFVRGDSLKEAIAAFHADGSLKADPGRRSLALRKLLRRFVDVCNAIDYAHTRGVLHRDIKPANVVLGKHGETLVVDWGLAKPMGHAEPRASSEERTLMPSSAGGSAETLPGSAMGTPAYMSPEQAAGAHDRLGPRADVYSLGATLYCLLTGRPPFEGEDLGAVMRAVQKGEFPPPRRLNPSVTRSLEAVCLKAMALKPEGRYGSARALADDVERWTADEPVEAYRDPWTTHARRWVGRNRTAVVAAASALVVAAAGLAALFVVQQRANRDLQAALAREVEARNKANAQFGMAREAVDAFYTGVSGDAILGQPQLVELRTKLLRTALQFYGRMQADLEADARSSQVDLYALALAYERVGEIQSLVGLKAEGLKAFEQALAIYESPSWRGTPSLAGKTLVKISRLHRQTGHPDEALRSFRQALDRLEAAAADTPVRGGDLAWCLLNLGAFLDELGRPEEALRTLERAREVGSARARAEPYAHYIRHNLAATQTGLGNIHGEFGRRDEAARCYEQARVLLERLVAESPSNTEYRADLARSCNNLGYELTEAGRPSEALDMLERGRRIREELYASQASNAGFRSDLARSHYHLARLRVRTGRIPEALGELRRAEELYEGVPVVAPEDLYYRACLLALHLPLIGSSATPPTAGEQAERLRYSDRAMKSLGQAVAGGFKKARLMETDWALDPLRPRRDFQLLMLDMTFPDNPFAR